MRWHKVVLIFLLFALATILAGVNTWYTAARSTIPLRLDTKVLSKEVRHEKHEGQDDVCLLELEGLGQMQVDHEFYERVTVGETLKKERMSHELQHGDKLLALHWSHDHRGMCLAMPICLGILAVSLIAALNVVPWRPMSIGAQRQPAPDGTR